jgi:predicted PurR-regulated permease PerM
VAEPVAVEGDREAARPQVPWRTILATIAVAAGAYLAWLLIVATQREITWLVVAAFFAVVLSPLVDFLVRRARLRRTVAAVIVFVVGFATAAGLLYLFIHPIVNQVNRLVDNFPRLVQDAQAGRGPIGHLVKKYDLVNKAKQYEPRLQKYVSSSGSRALSIVRKIGSGVVAGLTILVLTFLLLIEGPKILAGLSSLVSPVRSERLKRLGRDSSRAVSGYMFGNVLISVIASFVTYVSLWILGVPFRGVAALWVGFADLIPLVGATVGAIPTVGLAFLHSVTAGVAMIAVYVIYQQFENHVIQVAIMARTVRLSPLTVLVSLLIGVQLFGLIGALLAIPAAGIIQVVAVDVYRERQARRARTEEERGGASAPGAGDGAASEVGPDGGPTPAGTAPAPEVEAAEEKAQVRAEEPAAATAAAAHDGTAHRGSPGAPAGGGPGPGGPRRRIGARPPVEDGEPRKDRVPVPRPATAARHPERAGAEGP